MSDGPTVMIVEDDFLIAEDLRLLVVEFGARVIEVLTSAEGAAERIVEKAPDYVLMDVRLGGRRDGVDVAQQVHDSRPEIRLVFVTGSNEPPTIERIETDDPYRILIKPIGPEELREALGL